MDQPTRHQLLRDRRHWLGQGAGLAMDREGDLLLARVPAPADGRTLETDGPAPYPREVSGLAAGPCGALFVADTAHHRLLFVDGLCCEQTWLPAAPATARCSAAQLPGQLDSPRGLALAADALHIADSGHQRLQQMALPTLQPHLAQPLGGVPGLSLIHI